MVGKVKRTKRIEIAVTPDEFVLLNQLKTKPRLATWLRELGLGVSENSKSKPVRLFDDLELATLNKIGVNLNQIAKLLNYEQKRNGNILNSDLAQIAVLLHSMQSDWERIFYDVNQISKK